MQTDPKSDRPTITKRNLEWAKHNAAVEAREKAAGGDPRATAALLAAGAESGCSIGGLDLTPPAVGHLLLLQMLKELFGDKEPDVMTQAYALGAPLKVHAVICKPDSREGKLAAIKELVFEWALRVSTLELMVLAKWMQHQFGALGEADEDSEGNGAGEASSPTGLETTPDQTAALGGS